MDLIKTIAINPDNNCAARYLVVDAVNKPKVLNYYKENGFNFLFETDEEELDCLHLLPKDTGEEKPEIVCQTRLMYFDLILLNPKGSFERGE